MSLAGLSRIAIVNYCGQGWCEIVTSCKQHKGRRADDFCVQSKFAQASSSAGRCCGTIRVLGLFELARAGAVTPRNLSQGAARCRGAKLDGSDVRVRSGLVAVLDEKPLALPHSHQHPGTAEFLAVECEFDISFSQRRVDIRNFWLPRAAIPNHHGSA